MTLFSGLSAFPLTPTDQNGQLIPEVLFRYLDRMQIAGVDSIGLLGSTGSYAYLTSDERKRTVHVAVEYLDGKTPVIVGVGSLSTDMAVELARDATTAGANGLLLAPMSYQKLTEEEVYLHFETVTAASKLPLCIYNNPGTTNFIFSHDFVVRLSQLPNVVAVKMPLPIDGNFNSELKTLRSNTPNGFSTGYSGDWGASKALMAGADSWYSVVAGLLPGPALELTRAAQANDAVRVAHMEQAFALLWDLFKEFGSFRVMFALANALDHDNIIPLRPIQPIPKETSEKVRKALYSVQEAMTKIL